MKSLTRCFRFLIAAVGLATVSCLPAFGQFHNTGVFAVTMNLPAQMVVVGVQSDTVTQITLNNTAIVNLALGRPINTKLNSKTEVLAAAATFESHSNAPQSQLIVYDPTQNGEAGVRVVVATLQTLDWQNAYENTINTGFGIATGTINATTLGNPAQNGFLISTFTGGGSGSGKHLFSVGDAKAAPKANITVHSHIKFVYTDSKGTHNFDGIIANGLGSLAGKPIGGW